MYIKKPTPKGITELKSQVAGNMADAEIGPLLDHIEELMAEIERWKIQYEREAVQGDKFADIIERIASEGKRDRARAEAAESESAALVEKVERLEKAVQHYEITGVLREYGWNTTADAIDAMDRALLTAPATNDGYKHCKICGGKMCLDEDTWLCRGCPQTTAPATGKDGE